MRYIKKGGDERHREIGDREATFVKVRMLFQFNTENYTHFQHTR